MTIDNLVSAEVDDVARVLAGWRDAVAGSPDQLPTAAFVWSLPVIPELPACP